MDLKKLNSLRIGNVIRSIRTEKDIPIKVIASESHVSESTISQIETGKNFASIQRCEVIFNTCGCNFDFSIDFIDIKTKFFSYCDSYSQVNDPNLLNQLELFIHVKKYFYSFARFEYILILYLYSIISGKLSIIDNYELDNVIEQGFSCLDLREKSLYYDFRGTYYFYKNDIIKAREFTLKSLKLDSYNFMATYHYGIVNVRGGYFNIASIYLESATKGALYLAAFDRLVYISQYNALILAYTYQFEESLRFFSNLLVESKKRSDLRLENMIKSNIALCYLLQDKYDKSLKWIDEIERNNLNEKIMLYKINCLYNLKQYEQCKLFTKSFLENDSISKYVKYYLKGFRCLIDYKFEKAIKCFEICYTSALATGEIDKAIFDLKILEGLYKKFDKNKFNRVCNLYKTFYKMSHSSLILDEIDIKLN